MPVLSITRMLFDVAVEIRQSNPTSGHSGKDVNYLGVVQWFYAILGD